MTYHIRVNPQFPGPELTCGWYTNVFHSLLLPSQFLFRYETLRMLNNWSNRPNTACSTKYSAAILYVTLSTGAIFAIAYYFVTENQDISTSAPKIRRQNKYSNSHITRRTLLDDENWQMPLPNCIVDWLYWLYLFLSLIHIWRCRRSTLCRSRWSPYH